MEKQRLIYWREWHERQNRVSRKNRPPYEETGKKGIGIFSIFGYTFFMLKENGVTIPIVFAANEYFIPYTSAMIQSIMENASPENQYRFFILHSGISAVVLNMLSSQTKNYPYCIIEGINISERIKGCNFFTANRPDITAETYYRLYIPELLSDYDKVIYLDGDMICRSDISRLFAFDIGDNFIGAARDCTGISGLIRYGAYKDKTCFDFKANARNLIDCYNAGVMIFNIRQFQKTISITELLDLALSRKWANHDQDILNFVTESRTFFLPYSWNFTIEENACYLPETLAKEYAEAERQVKIFHFAGPQRKPWKNSCFVDYAYIPYFTLFWKYAFKTPFLDTIIARMEEEHILGGSYEPFVINQIKQRNGGICFILKCLTAWMRRNRA
ncbi:MAG: glycosyltransferase family 8 protein [Treponema sp.]|jgi:lipopolysaccharide biosynthesis glycosyltransferase|nr:glycosyltransferase family 8 protein [Treponema sp.]